MCIVSMVMSFELGRMGLVLEMEIFEYILVYGAVRMNQSEKGIENKKNYPFLLLFALGMAGYIFLIIVSMGKGGTTLSADTMIDAEVSSDINTAIWIEDENEKVIYRHQGKEFKIKDHRMLLRRGTYKIHIAYEKDNIADGEEKSSYVSYHID